MPDRELNIIINGHDKNAVALLEKINTNLQGVKKSSSSATTGTKSFSNGLGELAGKIGIVATAAKIMKAGFDFLKDSTILAARVSSLGDVTEKLGDNAGYSADEIHALEQRVAAQGITIEKTRESLSLMMQAELDLSKATDLARMAQDAAVIANVNSSESFERLVTVISSGSVNMARRMGIMVDFQGAYRDWAAANGRTILSLTEQEKVMIRTNEVLAAGEQITGLYATAQETAAGKAKSLQRHVDDLRVAIGELTEGGYGKMIDGVTEFVENTTLMITFQDGITDALENTNTIVATTTDGYEEYLAVMLDLNVTGTKISKQEKEKFATYRASYKEIVRLEQIYGKLTDQKLEQLLIDDEIDTYRRNEISQLMYERDKYFELLGAMTLYTEQEYEIINATDVMASADGEAAEARVRLAEATLAVAEASGFMESASHASLREFAENAMSAAGGLEDILIYLEKIQRLSEGVTEIPMEINMSPVDEQTLMLAGKLFGSHISDLTYHITVTGDNLPNMGGNMQGLGGDYGAGYTVGGGFQPGYATGADFVVPPGFPNDSYPIGYATTGERVIVETQEQQRQPRGNNYTYNVVNNGEQAAAITAKLLLDESMARLDAFTD